MSAKAELFKGNLAYVVPGQPAVYSKIWFTTEKNLQIYDLPRKEVPQSKKT